MTTDASLGDAFVADCAENIVHRKKVVHWGPTARAERPAEDRLTRQDLADLVDFILADGENELKKP